MGRGRRVSPARPGCSTGARDAQEFARARSPVVVQDALERAVLRAQRGVEVGDEVAPVGKTGGHDVGRQCG
ncbi:hypothetical protein EAO77_18355 [Streptomyces sp. t39]|nr:hypothetical protein EAO77_18355 [Streptomyces sp. t39]